MYFIALSFGYMVTFFIIYYSETCPLTYLQNISVQMLLFFKGLWPFVIKVTSGFKRSFKEVSSSSVYLCLPPFHD